MEEGFRTLPYAACRRQKKVVIGTMIKPGILKPQLMTQEQVSESVLAISVLRHSRSAVAAQTDDASVFAYRCAAQIPTNVRTSAETLNVSLVNSFVVISHQEHS